MACPRVTQGCKIPSSSGQFFYRSGELPRSAVFYYSQSWESSSLPRCSLPPGSESCTLHCSLFTSAQAGAATCIQRLLASSAFLYLFIPSTRTFPVIKRYARAYTPRPSFHWSTTWDDEDCRNRGLHLNPYLLLFSLSIVFRSLRPYGLYPPGSSVHGISQARILVRVAISFSKGSSKPKDWIWVSYIDRRILYYWVTREVQLPFVGLYIAFTFPKRKIFIFNLGKFLYLFFN